MDAQAKLVLAICEMYNAGVDASGTLRSLISYDTRQKRDLRHRHDWHLVITYDVVRRADYIGQTVLSSVVDKE